MKAVLISINPRGCKEIAHGKKTVEIRKTKPKLDAPFKCYIYETKGRTWQNKNEPKMQEGLGAVIGEFICDCVYDDKQGEYADIFDGKGLVPLAMQKQYGGNKPLYGWKIAELKIYDKPKPLSEFKRWNRTEENAPCAHTPSLYPPCKECKECNLKRPPQSWCYVEV